MPRRVASGLLLLLLLGALLLLVAVATAQPLLVGVVPSLPGAPEDGHGIAVAHLEGAPWDLSGHVVAGPRGAWVFPEGARLDPGEEVWVVGNATAWDAFGGPAVSHAWQGVEGMPQIGRTRGEVRLLGPGGEVLDRFAWGPGREDAVTYTSPGLVYMRLRGPDGSWLHTGTSSDWATPRPHRIGQSSLDAPTFHAQAVTVYASPDATHAVLTGMLAQARERIHLHVYSLRSHSLVDSMVEARERAPGLDLQVLVEAAPVGLTQQRRLETAHALQRVQEAGGSAWLAEGSRYRFHHLKVLVVDDAVAVQSENWVPAGVPEDPSWGYRGWGVVVHGRDAADWFAGWMAGDRASWDVSPFVLEQYAPFYSLPVRHPPPRGDHGPLAPSMRIEGPVAVRPVVSPDHTHDPAGDPILALVAGARVRVLSQQMDLSVEYSNPLGWRAQDGLLLALVEAASAGAQVRVLAASPFSVDDDGNREALQVLAGAAAGLDLEAKEFSRPSILALHNKGTVVDDSVVVGSINGNHHSRSMNREAALIVQSPDAAAYFAALFEADWEATGPPRQWSLIVEDLKALQPASLPTLLAALAVAALLRAYRCRFPG